MLSSAKAMQCMSVVLLSLSIAALRLRSAFMSPMPNIVQSCGENDKAVEDTRGTTSYPDLFLAWQISLFESAL